MTRLLDPARVARLLALPPATAADIGQPGARDRAYGRCASALVSLKVLNSSMRNPPHARPGWLPWQSRTQSMQAANRLTERASGDLLRGELKIENVEVLLKVGTALRLRSEGHGSVHDPSAQGRKHARRSMSSSEMRFSVSRQTLEERSAGKRPG
eukprot:scaffold2961_cov118-Isochrysis_galbana.AAC.6